MSKVKVKHTKENLTTFCEEVVDVVVTDSKIYLMLANNNTIEISLNVPPIAKIFLENLLK
jgi:hypothetical protein